MALGKVLGSALGLGGIPKLLAGKGVGDIARSGGLGLAGLMLAKKKKRPEAAAAGASGATAKDDTSAGVAPSGAAAPTMGDKFRPGMAKGGGVGGMGGKAKCYAKGGRVSSRADGIAKRGHTKGKIC